LRLKIIFFKSIESFFVGQGQKFGESEGETEESCCPRWECMHENI